MYPENKSQMRKNAGLPDTGSVSDPSLRLFLDRIRQRFTEMENKLAYYESDAFIQKMVSAILNSQNFQTQLKQVINNTTIENENNVGGSGNKNRGSLNIYIASSLSALIGVRNNGTSATLFANAPADEEKVGVLGGSGGSVHWLETDEC